MPAHQKDVLVNLNSSIRHHVQGRLQVFSLRTKKTHAYDYQGRRLAVMIHRSRAAQKERPSLGAVVSSPHRNQVVNTTAVRVQLSYFVFIFPVVAAHNN